MFYAASRRHCTIHNNDCKCISLCHQGYDSKNARLNLLGSSSQYLASLKYNSQHCVINSSVASWCKSSVEIRGVVHVIDLHTSAELLPLACVLVKRPAPPRMAGTERTTIITKEGTSHKYLRALLRASLAIAPAC
jgi:hypothetical protein